MTDTHGYDPRTAYSADDLDDMPTLEEGQADDLKVDDREHGEKIWLSRCSAADGEPFDRTVTIELRDERGRWYNAVRYDGDDPTQALFGTYEEPVP